MSRFFIKKESLRRTAPRVDIFGEICYNKMSLRAKKRKKAQKKKGSHT